METKIFGGKKITISKLAPKDLKDAKIHLGFINSLHEEDIYLVGNKKLTIKEERKWLKERIVKQKEKKCIYLVVYCGKELAGNGRFELLEGKQNHIAVGGLAVARAYRGIGLGETILMEGINLARKSLKPKPIILQAGVFAANKPSYFLMRKFNFKEVALIPKQFRHKGKLIDEIIMQLHL